MKIKNLLIGITIIILLFLVNFYAIETFYPKPQYEDFCGDYRTQEIITNQEQCEAIGGQWNPTIKPAVPETGAQDFCNRDYTCRQEYETVRAKYSQILFIITTILAIILISIGAVVFKLEPVGSGIMGGGIITLLYGAGSYWPEADNLFKLIISLISLIIIIYLGYWINKKNTKK